MSSLTSDFMDGTNISQLPFASGMDTTQQPWMGKLNSVLWQNQLFCKSTLWPFLPPTVWKRSSLILYSFRTQDTAKGTLAFQWTFDEPGPVTGTENAEMEEKMGSWCTFEKTDKEGMCQVEEIAMTTAQHLPHISGRCEEAF